MGASQVVDQNIVIFVRSNKQFYIAGDYVQGEIYLRVKQPSVYTKLVAGVNGQENVFWKQEGENSSRKYTNNYKSYSSFFVVHDFNGNVPAGDYTFPFAFLLPNMITGSFFFSKHCFLKYTLKAQLVHPTQEKRSQFYQMFLNLLQPPRMPLGPTTTTTSVNSKCCGCCANYGTVSVTLNSDRNFAMNGDLLQISGVVDNSRGTAVIQSSRILLQRRRMMIASDGQKNQKVDQQVFLYNLGPIQPHDHGNFNFSAQIPQTLVHSTAIGRIVGMYYVIHLYTNYGCCSNKAEAQLHIIFHSKTPMIVKPQLIQQPPNWYPQVMQKCVYQNMSLYVYNPDTRMPFVNLPSNNMMYQPSLETTHNQMNEDLNSNQQQGYPELMVNKNENWSQNHSYKPVFYEEQMINDAHREYLKQSEGQQSQGPLIRKL